MCQEQDDREASGAETGNSHDKEGLDEVLERPPYLYISDTAEILPVGNNVAVRLHCQGQLAYSSTDIVFHDH